MLQKVLFESSITKTSDKSFKHQKRSSSSLSFNPISFSKKILYHKYSKFEYSFSLFCTNNLIFNEKCRIVARFKDFLVLDDTTEFLRRFYSKKELKARLKKIFNFYESYCKIFPNYMILPESQFLYRNIRKKQKMIDAFNEIKREEEENRKHLNLGLANENLKNKEENIVFTEKIQESIDRYHPSMSNLLSNTFMSEISNNLNNDISNNDKSTITITLNSQLPLNLIEYDKFFLSNKNSSLVQDKNLNDNTINSQNSIFKIVQIMNNNNIIDNVKYNSKITNNNNIVYNKINKIEYKNNVSQSNNNNNNKINKKNNINTNSNNNNINNNVKHNTKKLLNINNHKNNFNTIASNSNKNINLNYNKINNNSNHKNKDNNSNKNKKRKFISHKQTVSVPLASNMLNSNDNNILEEKNTIKIINNINNIIINEDKNKTINNGMIININNNYFQLKNPKKINNKIIKRVKSKEEQKKEQSKGKKLTKDKEEKEEEFPQFKIFREKRTYTNYNTNNKTKQNKKFLLNDIQSPNKKKENINSHIDNKKINNINKNNTNNYYININNNNNKQNNVYRNTNNFFNTKKNNNKKLIESKTLNNNSHIHTNNTTNKNITEINNNYNNIFGNKLKKNKDKPKLEGTESIDTKKISINRKIVNNYFTTTQKKKQYLGRFQTQEGSSLNPYNNNINSANKKNNNDFSDKIEVLNILNTIQNKNNAIKFKLDKKNMMRKNKTNSLKINNKNEFLNSFNITKDKLTGTNIEIDIINIEENNIAKYHKKSIKKYLNNKTQSNSEAELIKDMTNKNSKNTLGNTCTSKSLKKDKVNKNNNEKKIDNNNNNDINNNNGNEMKKINVKEMKEKYHKLLRGNKFTHGSYDTTNRLHLLKKFRGLNNGISNTSNINNNTITSNKNKRSPLTKKGVLSPSKNITNNLSNYIKTPIKSTFNINNKEISIENSNNNNIGGKLQIIGIKNKQLDTNNKKMKFVKK